MRLEHLQVENFRNLESAQLTPSPVLTVICGPNGQGKTNLLEAIWLLTGGKSFRGAKDAELIRRDAPFAVLEARFQAGDRDQQMRLTVGSRGTKRPGRTVKLNGADRGRAASIAGTFTAVVFDPNHLSLVKGGPEGRRRFLDAALCQLYPGYLVALRRYARTVAQKNALLKAYDITPRRRHAAGNLQRGSGKDRRRGDGPAHRLPGQTGPRGGAELPGHFQRGRDADRHLSALLRSHPRGAGRPAAGGQKHRTAGGLLPDRPPPGGPGDRH